MNNAQAPAVGVARAVKQATDYIGVSDHLAFAAAEQAFAAWQIAEKAIAANPGGYMLPGCPRSALRHAVYDLLSVALAPAGQKVCNRAANDVMSEVDWMMSQGNATTLAVALGRTNAVLATQW